MKKSIMKTLAQLMQRINASKANHLHTQRFLVFLTLVSGLAFAQDSRRELVNIHNDKYMTKYQYQNNNEIIVCQSNRNQRAHCRVNTRYGVNFIRQLSHSSCNYNWGYDTTGIWVDNGCRAEFSVNLGWDQPGSENNIMVCESHRYKRNYCPAYLGGRDVFMLNQLSSSSCLNNWGYDRNGVWVTNGCRAEFVVEDRHSSQNDILICSSRNLRFQTCTADTRGGVDFIRQLSRASCNGNWGYDRNGIWVTNGCRAKFKLLPYNYNYNNRNDYQDTISCSSRNLKRRVCPADTSGGVRLKKQKSRSSCRGNWGFTANHIWVDNGCRATFQLYINGRRNNNAGHNGYGNNNGNSGYRNNSNQHHREAQNITCSSKNRRRKTCEIPHGSKVKLLRQISNSSCVRQWGYDRHKIWVDNGCRAVFSVH